MGSHCRGLSATGGSATGASPGGASAFCPPARDLPRASTANERFDCAGVTRIDTCAGTVISSTSLPFLSPSCHGFVESSCCKRSCRGRCVFAQVTSGSPAPLSNGFTRHRSQSSRTVSSANTCGARETGKLGQSSVGRGVDDTGRRRGFEIPT